MPSMNTNYFVCTLGQASSHEQSNQRARSIGDFLQYQAQEVGQLPAVAFPIPHSRGDAWDYRVFTFEAVNRGTRLVAELLLEDIGDVLLEPQTVALLCPSSVEFLYTWLALIKLGHAVLLIAPQCQPAAIAHLCRSSGVSLLFHDGMYVTQSQKATNTSANEGKTRRSLRAIPLPFHDEQDMHQLFQQSPKNTLQPHSPKEGAVAYLHHTSGTSSGLPKPIPQTHRAGFGVLPHLPEGKKKATFTTTPLYHGGIADLFRAWTSDALIWLFPGKDVPITTQNINRCLECAQRSSEKDGTPPVEYFSSVPYVLQMLEADEKGAQYLKAMGIVGVGGAALPTEVGNRLVENGINLISRFGSAECGFLMSSHRDYTKDKEWQYLRDSNPSGLLEFERRDGGLAELVIKPGWPHMAKTTRPDGSFATADLFTPHPSIPNAWQYHSRADSQLTLITGKKFDSAPLESAIATSHLLDDVLIFGNGRPYPGALLFRSETAKDMADEELIRSLACEVERLNSESQDHARIPRSMLVPMPYEAQALEKSSKGTIIRNAAEKKYNHFIEEAYSGLGADDGKDVPDESVPEHITELVEGIVMKPTPLKTDTDLFTYGVDSVACMQLRHGIRKLLPASQNIPLSIVEDSGTIDRLSEWIIRSRHGKGDSKASVDEEKEMLRLVEQYGTFEKHQSAESVAMDNQLPPGRDEVVVLTGATGALGTHILNVLRGSPHVSKIYCLVRGADEHSSRERVNKALEQKGLDDLSSASHLNEKIVVLQAQLGDPQLGLDQSTYDKLVNEVTSILHVAWTVNFRIRLSSFVKDNISGVRNLIDLALKSPRSAPPKFAYCSSTASVIRYPKDQVVPECILDDTKYASPLGYARSKWVAEQICYRAHQHTRLRSRISVMRVGQLSGDSLKGIWNAQEAWPMMLSSVKLTGSLPNLHHEPLSWLPVDVAAKAFVEAADYVGRDDGMKVYHILNEHREPDWGQLLQWLRKKEEFDVVSPAGWVKQLEQYQDKSDHPALKLLSHWREAYSDSGAGTESAMPQYSLENTKTAAHVLQDVQLVSEEYVSKIWSWLQSAVG